LRMEAELSEHVNHLLELILVLIRDLSEHSSSSVSGRDDRAKLTQVLADCTLLVTDGALKNKEGIVWINISKLTMSF
jgi:hypothetical protein